MEPIVRLRGVSKSYKRYKHPAHRLHEILSGESRSESFTALQPIDLDIMAGETVAIVGRNGSGKSTLLKLIAGVLTPTTGTVAVTGRISTLLELGSGFNPEFTGRENVYFNGSLAGLSRAAVTALFDDILDFSEIGDFIDRPVRTYSSGMFVRLAFAVAVHLDPQIMLIDEALAVGDVFFQQKCFERLRAMRDRGVTIIFVSHDSTSVQRLCNRAVLLEHGAVRLEGDPRQVISVYQADVLRESEAHVPVDLDVPVEELTVRSAQAAAAISADGDLESWGVELLDEDRLPLNTALSGQRIIVRAFAKFSRPFSDPHLGFRLRDRFGVIIYETNTLCQNVSIGETASGETVEGEFTFEALLAPGDYTITLGVADGAMDQRFRHILVFDPSAARLTVLRDPTRGIWNGVIDLRPGTERTAPIRHPVVIALSFTGAPQRLTAGARIAPHRYGGELRRFSPVRCGRASGAPGVPVGWERRRARALSVLAHVRDRRRAFVPRRGRRSGRAGAAHAHAGDRARGLALA